MDGWREYIAMAKAKRYGTKTNADENSVSRVAVGVGGRASCGRNGQARQGRIG